MAIVVETDAQLEELRQHLRDAGPRAYKMYYHVDFHIKHGKYGQRFVVNKWPSPNIVFQNTYGDMLMSEMHSSTLYTTEATTDEEAREFLIEGNVYDWNQDWILVSNQSFEWPEIIREKKASEVICSVLELTHPVPERSLPEGYHFCIPIEEGDIDAVNQKWKFGGGEGSRKHLESVVQQMHSVAVKDSVGNLVAFEMQLKFGAVGVLYVDPNHRGKGIAKCVMAKLANLILADGEKVFCAIEKDNAVSYKLHTDFGYQKLEKCEMVWVTCTKTK